MAAQATGGQTTVAGDVGRVHLGVAVFRAPAGGGFLLGGLIVGLGSLVAVAGGILWLWIEPGKGLNEGKG